MVAYQLYRVEIDLKPIYEKCGMPVEGIVAPPMVESCIPWSYNRNQVPDLFARKEVPLDAWKRAVDSAETLFKDRYAALERAKRPWEMCVWMTLSMYLFVLIKWTFHLFQAGGRQCRRLYPLCFVCYVLSFFHRLSKKNGHASPSHYLGSHFFPVRRAMVPSSRKPECHIPRVWHHRAGIYKQRQGARP